MTINPLYMIEPSLQEIFVDPSTGIPLSGGSVTYYSDVNRSTLKPVFELSGSPPNYSYDQIENPAPLSGGGTLTDGTNDILPYYYPYDSNGDLELYYIVVKNSAGTTMFTRQGFPNLSVQGGITSQYGYDFVRNQSFYNWSTSTTFTNISNGSGGPSDFVADDWHYINNDSTQTISISQGTFTGLSPFPSNSPTYLIYANTGVGSAQQTINSLFQNYKGVQTLQGQTVTISLQLNQFSGGSLGAMTVQLIQNFGSGGSTAFPIPVGSIQFGGTNIWKQYTFTVAIPSVVGKTIGPGSNLQLQINFPLNVICTVYVGDVQFQLGPTVAGIVEKSQDDVARGTNYQTAYSDFKTGDVKMTIRSAADIGWLMMDDTDIGSIQSGSTHTGIGYKALFEMLWNNVHNLIYTPMYSITGTLLSSFGASAEADWNAGNSLSLTKQLGRVMAGAAPSSYSYYIAITGVSVGSGAAAYVTIPDVSSFYTGSVVNFTNVGGSLPGGLNANVNYWVKVSAGANLQMSTSFQNLLAGTYVPITSIGSGTNYVNISYGVFNATHPLGQPFGEESHLDLTNEVGAHSHTFASAAGAVSSAVVFVSGASVVGAQTSIGSPLALDGQIVNSPANNPHNTIQTTTYLNVMIKL